jgi:serine/threonine protein kinase
MAEKAPQDGVEEEKVPPVSAPKQQTDRIQGEGEGETKTQTQTQTEGESGHRKMTMEDFERVQFLGEGSYAKVILVRHKETGKTYAMKAILKSHMTKVISVEMGRKRRSIRCE